MLLLLLLLIILQYYYYYYYYYLNEEQPTEKPVLPDNSLNRGKITYFRLFRIIVDSKFKYQQSKQTVKRLLSKNSLLNSKKKRYRE